MIQLLALDLDDTLLGADLNISNRNLQALKSAEEKGVRVVLASGRVAQAMDRYAEQLGLFERPGYMISDNGSTVSATLPRAILRQYTFDRALLLRLFDAFELLDLPVQVYRDRTILATKACPKAISDVKLSGFTREVVPNLARTLDFAPTKIVVPGDPEVLPTALAVIRHTFGSQVNALISKPYYLEILPRDADKGTALRYVAEALGIPAADVMAIGDAANDLGMIQYAGWGVAVANGTPEVRRAARIVTDARHDGDGVAEVIEAYLLRNA